MAAIWQCSRSNGSNSARLIRASAWAIGFGIPLAFAATLYSQYAHELADAEQQVSRTVRILEGHALRTIEGTDAYLLAIASLVGSYVGDERSGALHASLHEQFVRSRGLSNIVVIDRNGIAVAEAAVFPTRALNVRDRDYFQELRDRPGRGLAIGRPIVGSLTGQLVVPIARRIESADGTFTGIVQAVLDAEAFQTFYDAIDDGPGALANLWRADHTLLVRSPRVPELVGRRMIASEGHKQHLATRDTKGFWSVGMSDGAERVIALARLDGFPLYVGASQLKSEVLSPWRRSALMHGALGGALTLVLVVALSLLAREIEKRQGADARIRASERRFRLLAENSNDVILLGDLDMRVVYVSPAVGTVLGYNPDELVGQVPFDFVHPDDAPKVAQAWADMHSTGHERIVASMRHRHQDGHYVWIEVSVRLVREDVGGRLFGYVATLRDITDRRKSEEQVRHMALHDALTGLPNRALLYDRLAQAIARTARTGSSFAVLACDLDRFKAVNDSLGHPAGDALLRVVAERMQVVVRPYDTVARIGGDEFAVVLTDLAEPCAAACVAERMIAAVGEPIDLDGQMIEVGISIGFTIATDRDADADDLFKHADIALYEAKAAGRNTYRAFCPDAGARIATRGQLGLDMKDALRRGEFRLAYQPVVDARTGLVVSFEALMRWSHPVRGEISPGEFIPMAEENGLIVPLGAWALREACREALSWPEALRVGVNVSPVQFRDGLEEAVLGALASTGLPARRLKLEVTESVLMQDGDAVLACLHRLRELGVLIALDDFGTGYSSLSYLRRFPFDKIKIDRSFIRDIADPDAAAIVRAVVGIGERLGMGIVAEGVETVEQLELVQREGCAQVQGFLFSRPLSPDAARAYIAAVQAKAA